MSDLFDGMRIEVSSVLAPPAGDRPAWLRSDQEWPPPDGKLVIYSFTRDGWDMIGVCLCSDCIRDQDIAETTRNQYIADTAGNQYADRTHILNEELVQVPLCDNRHLHCCAVLETDRQHCRRYGDQL